MRRVLVLLLLVVVAGFVFWHPARVAGQALLLLPAVFPAAPFDPLSMVTPAPSREDRSFPYAAGTVDAQLFRPAGVEEGRHGAMVLLLGAGDLPRSDVAVHFAEALARLGVVVLIPESSGMLAERLTFDEVDAVRQSLDVLAALPDVDTERLGLLGLSASGGLSIVAVAQPDLRDRVRFVNSFGSYADATSLLVDVMSRSIDVDGQVQPWQPEERTREVVSIALGSAASAGADAVSAVGDGVTRERAMALVGRLPAATRAQLDSISPSTYLSQLHAHLYLMHDVDDSFIPFTQSRELAASAPPGIVQRFTEFSIFAHVIPERPVPWQTFLPDLWRLFWHVHAVLLEVL